MKTLKTVSLCVLLFFAFFMFFFPWNAVQSYAVTKIFNIAARNGIYIVAQNCPTEGFWDKKFVCAKVTADMPMMQLKTDRIAVNPEFLRTLSGTPSVEAELGRGSITLITKQQLVWNEGVFSVSAGKDTIAFHNIKLTGAFAVQGFAEIARSNGEISRAQLSMKIPEEAEAAFEFLSKGLIHGLEKISAGQWRLVR